MLAKAKDLDPNRSELTPIGRSQGSIMTARISIFLNFAKVINGFGDNPRDETSFNFGHGLGA
jgi:hypothetical protein